MYMNGSERIVTDYWRSWSRGCSWCRLTMECLHASESWVLHTESKTGCETTRKSERPVFRHCHICRKTSETPLVMGALQTGRSKQCHSRQQSGRHMSTSLSLLRTSSSLALTCYGSGSGKWFPDSAAALSDGFVEKSWAETAERDTGNTSAGRWHTHRIHPVDCSAADRIRQSTASHTRQIRLCLSLQQQIHEWNRADYWYTVKLIQQ